MPELTLRLMVAEDLPLVHAWLNEPGVMRWWEAEDVSREAVDRNYSPDADDESEPWIALIDGEPFGWMRWWPVAAYPEETEEWLDAGLPEESTIGIDTLIGLPELRGRGLGSRLMKAVFGVLFNRLPWMTHIAASPFTSNEACLGASKRAGFTVLGTIEYPVVEGAPDDGPCSLIAISRDDFDRANSAAQAAADEG